MGDPFSIASGAAGVVSLGITVCSGLLDYYSSWKDSDKNIATMYASLEGLTKTFKLMRDTIGRSSFAPDVAERVLESTKSCEDGVNGLEKRLKKLGDPNSAGLESKIRIHARKALYPFKESTLMKLREIIGDLRDNLSLAIDALQMYDTLCSLKSIEGYID